MGEVYDGVGCHGGTFVVECRELLLGSGRLRRKLSESDSKAYAGRNVVKESFMSWVATVWLPNPGLGSTPSQAFTYRFRSPRCRVEFSLLTLGLDQLSKRATCRTRH